MPAPAYLTPGDLLKAEADYHSRIAVPATKGLKAGQFVLYPTRGQYLVALTDELYGQVLVQPHSCTINLDNVAQADIDALHSDVEGLVPMTVEALKKQGDDYGIKYVGTPYLTA